MDSDDDDCYDDNDSSEENEEDSDEEFLEPSMPNTNTDMSTNMEDDVFSYQCLSPDEVVSLMTESIRDVNEILNVCSFKFF